MTTILLQVVLKQPLVLSISQRQSCWLNFSGLKAFNNQGIVLLTYYFCSCKQVQKCCPSYSQNYKQRLQIYPSLDLSFYSLKMKTARRTKESSSPFNIMKKYLQDVKEDIYYSEEEEDIVKKEQPLAPKESESSNALVANLRLQSYGDLFLSENKKIPQDNAPSAQANKETNDDDFYLPEGEITSSQYGDLSVEVSNSELLKKKGSYNKRKSGRKLRTAITKEKLEEINNIFKDYHQKKQNGTLSQTTLKEIGDRLHLGYSTILHKYKEFKQNKQVKGGYLLEIQGSKRKYSKSVKVETLIREALQKVQLANAVQISKYIFKTKQIYYSRAVICRHLLAMKRNLNWQGEQIAESVNFQQKEMQPLSFEDILSYEKKNGNIVYCHQIVFSTSQLLRKAYNDHELGKIAQQDKQSLTISLVFAINQSKLMYYILKQGLFSREEYYEILGKICRTIREKVEDKNQKIYLAVNLNQVHYDKNTGQRSGESILSDYNIEKIVLSPQDLGLEPLSQLFQNIKWKLENKPKKLDILKEIIQSELKQWMECQQRFSF